MDVHDKNNKIFIYDDLHPEDGAMLQALYSRSPDSVVNHLEKVKKAGSGKFMESYYVGYGHASIGDCGNTTLFIENYSMLVAKAIQDNPLYSGQEASTRYLDFSQQPMVNPVGTQKGQDVLDGWMAIYNRWMPVLQESLCIAFPFDESQKKSERVWRNAINARAFDIMRGLLPVGTTTLLSWTTNLRQARDRLMILKNHPLAEVRQVAQDLFAQLYKKYPNSFNGEEMKASDRYAARDAYAQEFAGKDAYQSYQEMIEAHDLSAEEKQLIENGHVVMRDNKVDVGGLNRNESKLLATRPKGASLPRRIGAYGQYDFLYALDFGSFRDIQRHRGGITPMPLIDDSLGFHPWYLEQMKTYMPDHWDAIKESIDTQLSIIRSMDKEGAFDNVYDRQYYYPMGMRVPVAMSCSLPQAIYVIELRSQQTVHPTIRPLMQSIGRQLKEIHPDLTHYVVDSPDKWDIKRGEQTISSKDEAA